MPTEEAPVEKPEQPDLFGSHADRIVSKLDELQRSFVPARTAAAPAQPKVRYTTAQLQQAVDEGKINTAQMIEVVRLQDREDLSAEMDQRVNQKIEKSASEQRLEAKAQKYVAEYPDFNDRGSELWKSAAAEYQELLDEGHEDNSRTRLEAMKLAVRGHQKPEAVKETTAARQRSVETPGASAGRAAKKAASSNGWPTWLGDHIVEYYERAIEQGRYAGRDDPMLKKEMEIREKRHKKASAA